MAVPLNGNVELSCVTDGNPLPDITWLLDGTIIPGAMASTYSISPVTAESGGVYTCMASNTVRMVSADLTLTVLCELSACMTSACMCINFSAVFVLRVFSLKVSLCCRQILH